MTNFEQPAPGQPQGGGADPVPPGGGPAGEQPGGGEPAQQEPAPRAPFDPGAIVDSGVVTSPYGPRDGGYHYGVDIDTPAGGDDVEVHCPVSGTVEFVGGDYGTVSVRDDYGYLHQFLHLDEASVEVGAQIDAGDSVGIMGGTGPDGPNQYEDHVHYQVRDPDADRVNPVTDFPHYGDQEQDGAAEEDGPGDPPGEGGPGSYGEGAPAGAAPEPGGANPPAPPPEPGAPESVVPLPLPQPDLRRAFGQSSAQPAPCGLLDREVARLERLERAAAAAGAGGPWAAVRRNALLATALEQGRTLQLIAEGAAEAAHLGEELLAARSRGAKGSSPKTDLATGLATAAYAGRARAYELTARMLTERNAAIVKRLGGGTRG